MSPRRIRVLVIDDSAVVRKLVTEALSHDPEVEVVGTAVDPFAARDKILQLKPDVLTLDLEMPRMDGLTFLKIIMHEKPMPVIIMSSLTQSGSHHALEALRLGAVDVLAKPGGPYSFGDLGPQLVAKVKAAAIARIRPARLQPASAPPAPRATAPRALTETVPASPGRIGETRRNPAARSLPAAAHGPASGGAVAPLAPLPPPRLVHPRRLIVLGASTGGTEALREVLSRLPGDLPPIAIVQHIPATFSRAFADRLDALCAFEVREARDGDRLVPGVALVAPGNFHMMVQWSGAGYTVRVTSGPLVWHQRPAVDLLFRSAADAAGHHAIAGVLTGMGKDGAEGLLQLRQKGALTFSQDEESCVVYGMPRAAWELGGSQAQVDLDAMPAHLLKLVETAPHAPAATSSPVPPGSASH